jgi:hypothetical protein
MGGLPARGLSSRADLNSALFALHVGEALEETHSSLSHIVRPISLK